MSTHSKGYESFFKLVETIRALSVTDPLEAKRIHPLSPSFASHISKLFLEDRLFDVLPRLDIQLDLVSRFAPPVRPALDPYTSTQIGVFSKSFDDYEIGHFLGYPACCMRSFSENVRYGFDDEHLSELRASGKVSFAATAGFIPCSIFCKSAQERGLLSFVDQGEADKLRALEKETVLRLPHFHPEYREHYFEIRSV